MSVVAALLLVVVACSKGAEQASPSPSSEPTQRGPSVAFHAYNVHLDTVTEEGFEKFQALVVPSDELSVRLFGTDGKVQICPLAELDAVPSESGCVTPPDDRATSIAAPGVAVIRNAGTIDLDEIRIAYRPIDRTVKLRLPNIAPKPGESACKDNGCNPFFEMTPRRAGTLHATATWDAIATGRFSVIAGRVVDRAYSSGGMPYRRLASTSGSSDQGPPDLAVTASVKKGEEVAVVLENEGARLLRLPRVDITWP